MKSIKKNIQSLNSAEENNDIFQTLIEAAPDAFLWGDSTGKLIAVNNKAVELTGYKKGELLSLNISELFLPGELESNPLRYDLLDKGMTLKNERSVKTKSGVVIQVEMNSKAMPDSTYQSFLRDITERKKTEEVIRVSEARLTRAEIVSKSGNWELHLDTMTMVASVGATKIYGVEKDQMDFSVVKKVPLQEYRSKLDMALKELIENGKPYDIEFKIRALDTGEIKDIHSIAKYDREKKILFGAIQDITDYKKVEEELIKAKEKAEESDNLKTAFLQNLSHEIRTPMNAIIGFSELLTDVFDEKEKLDYYTGIIRQRCYDLLDIINDILDIARIESGQLPVNYGEVNLNSLFGDLTAFFEEYRIRTRKKNIKFNLKQEIEPTENIITDKVKLNQILINLISNAFKFTQKGSVTVGCRKNENNNLLFYVSDTGIGIPPEKQQLIFERFIQLNQISSMNVGGNGLGLSIVNGLVKLLGGEISVESEVGKGSTFSFNLPVKFDSHITENNKNEITPTDRYFPDKTILIVEDDQYNKEFLMELLSAYGLNILHVSKGKEAVKAIKKNHIDLVLMDIRLPDIDGYEVTKQVKKLKPDLKIIAQTAYASPEEEQKARQAGCNDYLSKPVKKDKLINILGKYI